MIERRAARLARGVAGCVLAAGCGCAGAAGFAILEQSVKGLGAAFSNSAAAEDASTVYFNPAGLARLHGSELQMAAHVLSPSATFTDGGSALRPSLTGGIAMPGSLRGNAGGEAAVTALLPNLYLHHELDGAGNGRVHLGLGINVPFALKTDYEEGWVGRYHALTSEVQTLNFNPSLAYAFGNRFAIGAGLNAQRIDARLTNAIDQSTVCLALAATPGLIPGGAGGCAARGLATPANLTADARIDLRNARDWSFGWNVGVLWMPLPSTRVGVHYRSKISHQLEGTAVLGGVDPLLAAVTSAVPGIPGLVSQGGSAKVTLPESASVHFYHDLNERWAVHGDVTWTRWSRFQDLVVTFADGASSVDPQDWDNSFRYSAGMTYRPRARWTLRAGVAFDETPIPGPTRRTARIPDEDRTWVAVGASYSWGERLSLDAGFAHLFVRNPQIRNTEARTGHVLVGEYEADVNIGSLQLVYRF